MNCLTKGAFPMPLLSRLRLRNWYPKLVFLLMVESVRLYFTYLTFILAGRLVKMVKLKTCIDSETGNIPES